MFVGRKKELSVLEDLYHSTTFEFLILYGRRRIGKTSLLKEFYRNKKGIFYLSEEKNDFINMMSFCEKIYNYFHVSSKTPLLTSWNDIFSFVSEQEIKERMILIIDEFPYLAQENKSLMSKLQHVIDHEWKDKNIFLILCGSSVSFMENEIMGMKSPLYGRRTSKLKLESFDYIESALFYADYTLEDKIKMYGIFGGVPQYLSMIRPEKTVKENVSHMILSESSYLCDEPIMLLKTELRNPSVYNSILDVMGKGATKTNDIAMKIHEETAKCAKYLDVLCNLGIIEKKRPIGEKEKSRNVIYQIREPFFHFWYRFISDYRESFALLDKDKFYDQMIEPYLDTYIGFEFETICTQYMKRLNLYGKLPFFAMNIGRWWGNNSYKKCEEDVDVLVIGKNEAMFCECKWRNILFDLQDLQDVKDASMLFSQNEKYYVLFSKSGFTKGVLDLAENDDHIWLIGLKELYQIEIK